jgi:hypothetical protein
MKFSFYFFFFNLIFFFSVINLFRLLKILVLDVIFDLGFFFFLTVGFDRCAQNLFFEVEFWSGTDDR